MPVTLGACRRSMSARLLQPEQLTDEYRGRPPWGVDRTCQRCRSEGNLAMQRRI